MLNRLKSVEGSLLAVIVVLGLLLSLTTDSFLTVQNMFDLLNNQAVNIIFAVGLVVVLVSGGIDISFSISASVVQYVVVTLVLSMGGGNWAIGLVLAAGCGLMLGLVNAFLIHRFRIVSIIVTIGTFNLFFGLLMYFTRGRSIYNIPDWLYYRIPVLELSDASLYLPIVVAVLLAFVTWFFMTRMGFGRMIIGFGSDPEAARRSGINIAFIQAFAYGWLGLCAGIGGLMQAHIVQEVVPNALYGRELEILAAVVLGGAVLGGGRGTVIGAILGVMLLAVVQNGLNLLGITPFAFKAIVGIIILMAITATNIDRLLPKRSTKVEG
ncbi:ABC transporter permease [Pseudovibrio exalbescens]|uniref:Sugar ABC transporter permease n=1 Tax=Pseudovibrio exalbescens TaxID=197461 RepID=A0A1U7JID6_9HYPH|nr:ABC transporter permease [Pseudovibrio exalbescens]OKL44513.1 sugar ABC transporter permease [Pseudovibrio exalbescens]